MFNFFKSKKFWFLILFAYFFLRVNLSHAGQTISITDGATISTFTAANGSGGSGANFNLNPHNNRLICKNIEIANDIWLFGASGVNKCSKNIVDILGNITTTEDKIRYSIFGGFVNYGTAKENSVNIYKNITLRNFSMLCGGFVNSGTVTENSVNISGVMIISSTDSASIYGGYVGKGNATENTTNISGTIISYSYIEIVGGYACSLGSNVNNNTVNISGNISADKILIMGGMSIFFNAPSNITNNTVNISGNISADKILIIGGRSSFFNDHSNIPNNIMNNKVNIYDATLGPNTEIYGGFSNDKDGIITGNKLKVFTNKPIEVNKIDNFEEYKFELGEGIKAGDSILSFNSGISATTSMDMSNVTKIEVVITPGNKINEGEQVNIMRCSNGIDGFDPTQSTGQYNGLIQNIESIVELKCDGKNIIATLKEKKVEVRPEVKSYSESRVGVIGFTNQVGDVLIGRGVEEISRSMEEKGIMSFGVLEIGGNKYDTGGGSDIRISGYIGLAGIGKTIEGTSGDKVTLGLFCEYGKGEYQTLSKIGIDKVKAEGNMNCIGAGVLGKWEVSKVERICVEGSFRLGNAKTDYNTDGIVITDGPKEIKYEYSGLYYGGHIGVGYKYEIKENIAIEFYVKYILAKQKEKGAKIIDEEIKFEGVSTQRLRLGGRWEYEVKRIKEKKTDKINIKLYMGTSVEEDLDGEIKAIVGNMPIEGVKLKGITVRGEMGIRMEIAKKWGVEVGGECFKGQMEGVSGVVRVRYAI